MAAQLDRARNAIQEEVLSAAYDGLKFWPAFLRHLKIASRLTQDASNGQLEICEERRMLETTWLTFPDILVGL
jgi:hypothetical protein